MNHIEKRLEELNIKLPKLATPIANYLPYKISGNLLFLSGQLPITNNEMIKGKIGKDISIEKGKEAAKLCAINILAQTKEALGSLDKVKEIIKLGAFLNVENNINVSEIINGASDFFVDVFESKGKHARFAIGVALLPLGAAVEIDAIIEFE